MLTEKDLNKKKYIVYIQVQKFIMKYTYVRKYRDEIK